MDDDRVIEDDRDDVEDLRQRVREWCAGHVPKDWRETLRGAGHDQTVAFMRWWAGELAKAGWLAPHWPKEWGGGFSVREQVVLAEELARGDAPRNSLFQVALYNVGPAIIHSGSDEQRQRFLPGILAGDVWCQGFSEPDAGSDLASLKTRAERDGDRYVINGQKIWTSMAMEADWCMLLTRTDRDAPKHKGISCLIVDMRSPGVEVRPIRQATGEAEFCGTFFDDVAVPVGNLLGPENEGWRVAQGTLASERAVVIVEMAERLLRNGIERLIAESVHPQDGAGWGPPDTAVIDALAEHYAEGVVLRRMLDGMISEIIRGNDVGGTASVIKVFYSELLHRTMQIASDMQGLAGQAERPRLLAAGWETGNWMSDYINSWGWLIGGGTNEIQRNVIAERVLGLPR
jgi:alkylation response protein AidB-like acyl-CoA dehydrogenase